MKTKSISLIVLLVGCVLAVYAIASPPANPQVRANFQGRQSISQSNGWQYAQLVAIDNDNFQWLIGGDAPVRTRSTRALLGDLGGNGKPTVPNLLNQIGSQGWELVVVDGTSWTFKRSR